jgi:hypothetical protein
MTAAVVWLCVAATFAAGIAVRQWVWESTPTIRFKGDIANGHSWGLWVCTGAGADPSVSGVPTWGAFFEGYRLAYDRAMILPEFGRYPLDYAPLRLLVMSLWARWTLARHGGEPDFYWRDAEPLLWFNTVCAAAAAAGAFVLVRHWVRREERTSDAPTGSRRPWLRGSVAAVLVWFNPAVLVDAHAWPQWDVWCVPFFLWAAYAASVGGWLWAGALVLTGSMLKAQIMLAAPVLLVWAVCSGGIRPVVELFVGFFAAAAVLAAIWLVPSGAAWAWVGSVVVAAGIAWTVGRVPRGVPWRAGAAAVAVALAWPLVGSFGWDRAAVLIVVWAVACLPLVLPKHRSGRTGRAWMAAVVAVCGWGAFGLFDGSVAWARIGFLMPTDARMVMSMGATNLPNLLDVRWGWAVDDPVWGPIRWLGMTEPVTVRVALRGAYVVALVLCGAAAAVHARRGSARVLVALAAPWVLFYALLPQMHDRHLMWAAAVTAIGVGVSLDLAVLHGLVSLLAFADVYRRLLVRDGTFSPKVAQFLEGITPDAGWVVLLMALAYLYVAIRPGPRRRGSAPVAGQPLAARPGAAL